MKYAFADTSKESLRERCQKGNSEAMLEMSKCGEERLANLWLVRAVLYGNQEARKILRENPSRASNTFLPIKYLIPGEKQESYGDFSIEQMKGLGIDDLHFDDKYIIFALSKERVFYIGRLDFYDSPDEDGYGEETAYSYYLYDEFFMRIEPHSFDEDEFGSAITKAKEYYKAKQDKLPALRVDWLVEDGILLK